MCFVTRLPASPAISGEYQSATWKFCMFDSPGISLLIMEDLDMRDAISSSVISGKMHVRIVLNTPFLHSIFQVFWNDRAERVPSSISCPSRTCSTRKGLQNPESVLKAPCAPCL